MPDSDPAPLLPRIGAVFVPVRDIDEARHWYARLLDLDAVPETQHGHLAVVPLTDGSSGLVLDAKIHRHNETRSTPLFHFNTVDLAAARRWIDEDLGAPIISDIQNEHWFTFSDPDGNVLMVCRTV